MRPMRLFFALACTALSAACSSTDATPTTPAPNNQKPTIITGVWQSDRIPLAPAGYYQTTLTLGLDASVTVDSRNYGVYPGQKADDLSAYTRQTGKFDITTDSLRFEFAKVAWWDRFYGADSPEHVMDAPKPIGGYSSFGFTLIARQLMLSYLSFPADAPVQTKATFHRP
jgi:hypothetical protein